MSVTAQKMCQWMRWNSVSVLVIFGCIPVAEAVAHIGVGFGVVGAVLGVDESVSFEVSCGATWKSFYRRFPQQTRRKLQKLYNVTAIRMTLTHRQIRYRSTG